MKTLKPRPPLSPYVLVSLFALLGCVNRGEHSTIGGDGGAGGAGGSSGAGGQMTMTDAGQDGVIDDGGVDAVDNCDIDGGSIDGGDAGPPSSCNTMFNFESPGGCGLYGAELADNVDNPPQTAAFSNLRHSTVAACGRGSMAVDVDFSAAARLGGGIIIPISRSGTSNFDGKTLSLSMMGTADGGSARFYVYLIANGTFQPVLTTPITANWQNFSVPLPVPDAGAASAENVMSISLEAFGYGITYKGTIYVDELDVRNTLDGGAIDGSPSDVPSVDGRDGATSDVRDAPAGS